MTKEKLFDVNSSNKNPYILKLKRDFKINVLEKAKLFYFQNVWLLGITIHIKLYSHTDIVF